MKITNIEKFTRNKIKIYIDYEYKFWLYERDLKKYYIKLENELSHEDYQELFDLNLKRAKLQVLNLLKRMDKTRYEVLQKLKQSGYNEDIIKQTLDYIDSYNYLDDKKYAKQYVQYKKEEKSKKEIENYLLRKGLSKDLIKEALEKEYDSEEIAIVKVIHNRTKGRDTITDKEKQKIISNLIRKGFKYDLIKKHIKIEDSI